MNNSTFEISTLGDQSKMIRSGKVLDNANADEFASLLMELYSADIKTILIDMAELEFLSSAGIGSILGTVELYRERGGDILLTNVSSKIYHILDVLNLADYLTIEKSQAEAVARLGR